MTAGISYPLATVPGREFAGRTAVITGASSGIGEAIAIELSGRGAALAAASRDRSTLGALPCRAFEADLATDAGLEAWIEDLVVHLPVVDLLIHAAGIIVPARMDAARIEDFDLQYRLNVRAPYRITQALLPKLRAARGQVVFVNSSAARRPAGGFGQYAATKAALAAVADSLRDEVNPDGIRVLTVYPGRTASPMQERLYKAEERPWQPARLAQPADIAQTIVQALLLPRTAEITEISIRPMLKD